MKTFILIAVCIAACAAFPGPPELAPAAARKPPVPILNMGYNNDNQGVYNLDVHSGDETRVHEQGQLRDLGGKDGPVNVKSGSYSYVSTDGRTYTVNWVADERGFVPTGEHLPTPPPIPEEIRRSLASSSRNI